MYQEFKGIFIIMSKFRYQNLFNSLKQKFDWDEFGGICGCNKFRVNTAAIAFSRKNGLWVGSCFYCIEKYANITLIDIDPSELNQYL